VTHTLTIRGYPMWLGLVAGSETVTIANLIPLVAS